MTQARPRRAVRVVDTVGAGDAFAAVALAGPCRGWDTPALLERAIGFAGHLCEVGSAVPAEIAAYQAWTTAWDGRWSAPPAP